LILNTIKNLLVGNKITMNGESFEVLDDCCGHGNENVICCSHTLRGNNYVETDPTNTFSCGSCKGKKLFPVCKQCFIEYRGV